MRVIKNKIRKLKNNFPFLEEGQKIYFGVGYSEDLKDKMNKIGFEILDPGTTLIPNDLGPISLFNSEGKYKKRKDLPMETAYRQVEWCWKQWAGRGITKDICEIKDVPYKRYPREYIPAPGIEFTLLNKGDELIIASPLLEYSIKNESKLVHTVNLFLEIFGECKVFYENLDEIIQTPIKRLNWEILPQGEMPFKKLQENVKPFLNKIKPGKRIVVENRLEIINNAGATYCAVGKAGFSGYIVLGFPEKELYLMESMYYGNATYIFGKNWRDLSQKTKSEIIKNSLQEERLIHREGWEENIKSLIESK